MYSLTKFPFGPCKRGAISIAVTASGDHEQDARPRIGVQMLVGAIVLVPGPEASARITSPIVRIVSDDPYEVTFETASGSVYRWAFMTH